jgi:hypothetical protein
VKTLDRVVTFLLVEATILCLLASYFFINNSHSFANIQSTASLVIFNVLFVSLMFQLNGSINRKLCLLTAGNLMGLSWNFIFNYLDVAGTISFGETFNVLYMLFFPFLSSIWIVSFWSLSLTFLHLDSKAQGKLNL